MKRLIALFAAAICFVITASAQQTIYLGTAGSNQGYIYEDGQFDDGTRYIISDYTALDACYFSLCKFIPQSGEPWYGIAIESKEYIPQNGLLVFVPKNSKQDEPIVLNQFGKDRAVKTQTSVGLSPTFFLGSGNIALSAYSRTHASEVFFAIYDISEEELNHLMNFDCKEIRFSTRSTYKSIKGWYIDRVKWWLPKAKGNIEARAQKSINLILEDF